MTKKPGIGMIREALTCLGDLKDEVVLLGGAAVTLLVTDPAAPPPRFTLDVDVVVEMATTGDYYRFAEKLRERGFREDSSEDAPICRWKIQDLLIDIMPTTPSVLGFGSRWYKPAFLNATATQVSPGVSARVVTSPYFLATKVDAFRSRGGGDYASSHDIEDIITVIDGRETVVAEVAKADQEVQAYLVESFRHLMSDRYFIESISMHLPPDSASQQRCPLVERRIRRIAEL